MQCTKCNKPLAAAYNGRVCKDCRKAQMHSYDISERGREVKHLNYQRHKREYAARSILNRAVARGIVRKRKCRMCPSSKTEGHHYDYKLPLLVVWLCRSHHQQAHKGLLAV